MAGFVEGVDRGQSTLFPALLDDYVADSPPAAALGDESAGADARLRRGAWSHPARRDSATAISGAEEDPLQ